ncbi:MAG: tyrosine-type recombinase/integrase [Terracidiphilus sp.]
MRLLKPRYQQGSITKIPRATGFVWRVRFSEWQSGKRRQKSLTFKGAEYPNESDVRKAIELAIVQQNRSTERVKVDALFGAITALYREKHLPGLEPSTRQTNSYILKNYIDPKFQGTPIRRVTPLAVTSWFNELKLAPTTKASIRSVMSQCFELAALHEYISEMQRNPMTLVKIKGTSKRQKKITPITIVQFRKLIGALPEPINIMALIVGSLGLRVSEMLALKWQDIDWKKKQILIQRKFTHSALGKTKTAAAEAGLPLDDDLLAVLIGRMPKTDGSEWIFPSPRNGGPRSASILLQKGLKPTAEKLALEHITWHTLRHACRNWLDANGTPMGVVKDLLRHADISTTMNIYGQALSPDMRRAHNKLAKQLVPKNMLRK